jgi:ribosome-associated protein
MKTPHARSRTRSRTPKLNKSLTTAIAAALDKKAVDVVVLDLTAAPAFTDFFVICTGMNVRQVQAIADAVKDALQGQGVSPALIEGYPRGEWILIDYFDFIIHVFTPATRAFYDLERLWGDAKRIEVSSD